MSASRGHGYLSAAGNNLTIFKGIHEVEIYTQKMSETHFTNWQIWATLTWVSSCIA